MNEKKLYGFFKGRIVFRGDCIRDETGHLAVFTEQGTSASHMAGTKLIDIIARFEGCDGEDADAESAYTQLTLAEAARLLGKDKVPETWVSLPRDRWPETWKDANGNWPEDPVCPSRWQLIRPPPRRTIVGQVLSRKNPIMRF